MIPVIAFLILATYAQAQPQNNQPGQVTVQIPLDGKAPPVPAQPAMTPPPTGVGVPTAPVSQVFSSDNSIDALLTEDLIRSLRDPFSPPAVVTKKEEPKSELELVELKDLRLNGVITGPRKVRAMLSANTKTFFVAVGDKVGTRQGRVTAIQPDLIKIVEYDVDERGRKVPEVFEMRITGEIVSLSKKDL